VRLTPGYAEAHNSLGLAMVERNVDHAIAEYQKALQLKPNFIEVQFNLALAYRRKYGVQREIEQLRNVTKLDPKHLLARNTLARRLEEINNNEELISLCDATV